MACPLFFRHSSSAVRPNFNLTLQTNQVYLHSPAPWPSGKARVCKTLISGPNPLGASTRTAVQIEWTAVAFCANSVHTSRFLTLFACV